VVCVEDFCLCVQGPFLGLTGNQLEGFGGIYYCLPETTSIICSM